MTSSPENDLDEPDGNADAMKDQLRKDVASWSASRSAEASGLATQSNPSAARQSAAPPPARAARQKAKPVEAPKPAVLEKKPFKMSYDGTTDRDYIAHRIKYGAR